MDRHSRGLLASERAQAGSRNALHGRATAARHLVLCYEGDLPMLSRQFNQLCEQFVQAMRIQNRSERTIEKWQQTLVTA